jgi:hypothetical protein
VKGSREIVLLDPLFDAAGAAAMVELCERFGTYRTYGEHEQIELDIGRGLTQRHDALMNFLRTGGLQASSEPPTVLGSRTSYFREEYAYADRIVIDGIQPFLYHEGLADAARKVHGRDVIEPVIAYANFMVPGQELAVHTDVPEFRGANRKVLPQWLMAVMHHSELFEEYRLPIATGIAWFHEDNGGELVHWPDGPNAPAVHHATRANTAMVLDTDTIFHGVGRIAGEGAAMPEIGPGASLTPIDGSKGRWLLADRSGRPVVEYAWDELRFSVSWKAYCFVDEVERDAWRTHTDDLTLDTILDRLCADLAERGVSTERDGDLGLRMIDEYIRFPIAA